jgi:hypothetical protein
VLLLIDCGASDRLCHSKLSLTEDELHRNEESAFISFSHISAGLMSNLILTCWGHL